MRKNGYTKATAKTPDKLTGSKAWQQMLKEINEEDILQRVREIALDDDKRASLQASDMIFKLKDLYPAQKNKVLGLFGSLEELEK